MNSRLNSNIKKRFLLDFKELKNKKIIPNKNNIKIKKIKKVGDSHCFGQAVSLVTLEADGKLLHLIYKPYSLGIDKAFEEFIQWINNKSDLKLRVPLSLSKDHYGWAEYISYKECRHEKEVKAYYRRLGALLGICLFLSATDIHHDNIIACGDMPIIIDHETFLTPSLKSKIEQNLAIYTAILPRWRKASNSEKYFDKSAFSGFLNIKNKKLSHIPRLNGYLVNPYNYIKNFLMGFDEIFKIFKNHKTILLSKENSPLIVFKNIYTRIVLKDTASYYSAIKEKNYLKYSADEQRALLNNDIPLFRINTTNKKIIDAYDNKINLSIIKSGYDRMRDQINYFTNNTNYVMQKHLIQQCIISGLMNYQLKSNEKNFIDNNNSNTKNLRGWVTLKYLDGYWIPVKTDNKFPELIKPDEIPSMLLYG
jgi:lantibiotic modifying enzyme